MPLDSSAIISWFTTLLESKWVLTFLAVFLLLTFRYTMLRHIRGDSAFINEKQRKWMSQVKNGVVIAIALITFFVWKNEINQFALSVTAIAVALVVASKEIILCFTGSIQRTSSRSFRIGDWIEVGTLCGEVIEHNLMATVIQELDLQRGQYQYTGKTATLPNSMFFTFPVKNLNFMKRFVFHHFEIVVPHFVNIFSMVDEQHAAIEGYCEDFYEVARRYNTVIERHAGVDLPGAEPQIHVTSNGTGEQIVRFMIFCPTDRAGELEQKVRRGFMDAFEQRFPHLASGIVAQ